MSEGIGERPFFVTFYELASALYSLHGGDRALLADLHDVWKKGAPSPDSIIRNPRGFDERGASEADRGNVVKRLIFPSALVWWIREASVRLGHPYSIEQCFAMARGEAVYTEKPVDSLINPTIVIAKK